MHGDSLGKPPLIPTLPQLALCLGARSWAMARGVWVIQNISLLVLLPSALLQAEAQRNKRRRRALKPEAAESLLCHHMALAP